MRNHWRRLPLILPAVIAAIAVGTTAIFSIASVQAALTASQQIYDVNGDGAVNQTDVNDVAAHFGRSDKPWDIDGNGVVNSSDVFKVASHFSSAPQPTATATRPPAPTPTPVSSGGACNVDPAIDSEERAFLTLINNYRAQNGLPALALSYTLTKSSAWKSADMGANRYFAHDDLSRTWIQRVRACGYGANTYAGENIAAGISTAQQAFDLWRNSPGHNANMLGTNYRSIGIGRAYVPGSPYGWYWTTDFGGVADGSGGL